MAIITPLMTRLRRLSSYRHYFDDISPYADAEHADVSLAGRRVSLYLPDATICLRRRLRCRHADFHRHHTFIMPCHAIISCHAALSAYATFTLPLLISSFRCHY